MDSSFFNSELYIYVVLPLLIFLARICDVTIGTLRIIFVSKGNKVIAPILGFFEVFIWIVVIGQIMSHLNNYLYFIAYAAGFAAGNYVGLLLEERMAMGRVLIRVISAKDGNKLIKVLNQKGFGATMVEGEGSTGRVQIIYSVVDRKKMNCAIGVIEEFNPKAFYSIEDIRKANAGIFPAHSTFGKLNIFRRWRKGM